MGGGRSHREVRRSALVDAPPEKVLEAFLDAGQMKQWWGVSQALVEPQPGGAWVLAWGDGRRGGIRYVMSGIIRKYRPGKWVRIEPLTYVNAERGLFGPMRLRVAAHPRRGRTLVVVRQDGYGKGAEWEWYYRAVERGWRLALKKLREFLEGEEAESPRLSAKSP